MLMLQVWFQLSDEGVEDAIYDSYAMKSFLGLNFAKGAQVPDATTLCKFRKLLHTHGLQKTFFDQVQEVLKAEGKQVKGGTIVDATIIEAPDSRKNAGKQRDPEMHSVKKGSKWHFGMRIHIGTDPLYGFVHTYPPRRPMPQRSRKRPTYCGKTMRWSMEMRATANWIAM